MAVKVACPNCAVTLNIPENFLGKKVRCASCSTVFEAKSDEPAPAADSPTEIVSERPADLPAPPPTPPSLSFPPEDAPPRRDDREPREDRWGDDDGGRRRRRSERRRDLEPHRGGMLLTMGIISIILGVIGLSGWCCCIMDVFPAAGVALGLTAWLMGQGDLKKIDSGDMDPDGRANVNTGYVCGIVGTALSAFGILCSIGWMIISLLLQAGSMGARNY